jgi:Do/DeqQ family serine protease
MPTPFFSRALLPSLVVLAMLAPAAPAAGQPSGPQRPPSPESRRLLHALEEAFAAVADEAMPSVVNVSVKTRRAGASESAEPPAGDERFREFFGQEFYDRFFRPRPPREESRAAGSGVIADARGYILTNNHVVEDAAEIEVRLTDDRRFKATIVGRDPKTDLAVLKIDVPSGTLPVARLGDSDKLRVGQWAIAIGNPFGLDRTVTVGIVSATGRTRVGVATYEAFIQTDASINPGNSGGPLLNLEGRVIGINTAILSSGQGIGFSIPINMARDIMSQLISKGRVVRGWIGVVIQDLTPELAAGFGVPPSSGVLVSEVMKGAPAEAAGIKAGDIIVDFDGAPTKEVIDLQKRVAGVPPGRATPLVVVRDGKRTPLTVRIGEQPGEEAAVTPQPKEQTLGLTVEPITPETAARFKLSAQAGVVVAEVAPGSSGEQAGIRAGDAILELARQPVADVDAFRRIMAGLKPGDAVPVYIQRGGGRNEYVVLTIPESQR